RLCRHPAGQHRSLDLRPGGEGADRVRVDRGHAAGFARGPAVHTGRQGLLRRRDPSAGEGERGDRGGQSTAREGTRSPAHALDGCGRYCGALVSPGCRLCHKPCAENVHWQPFMIVSRANNVEFLWKAQLDVEGSYKSSIIEIWLHNRVKTH